MTQQTSYDEGTEWIEDYPDGESVEETKSIQLAGVRIMVGYYEGDRRQIVISEDEPVSPFAASMDYMYHDIPRYIPIPEGTRMQIQPDENGNNTVEVSE